MSFQIGDYVVATYGMDEYIGQIKSIKGKEFKVEICTNRKKSEPNEVELITVHEDQLKPVTIANFKKKKKE